MNTLLIFFALPIATIILAIVLEKLLKCPILTAATFFAIYLIVAFAVFDSTALVFVIIYTIIAYITALLVELFLCRNRRECGNNNCINNNTNNNSLSNEEVQNIANRVARIINNSDNTNNIATVNIRNTNGTQSTWCCRRK